MIAFQWPLAASQRLQGGEGRGCLGSLFPSRLGGDYTSHEHGGGEAGPDAASGLLRVRSDAGIPGAKKINDPGKLQQLTASVKSSGKSCKEEKGLSNFPKLCTVRLPGGPVLYRPQLGPLSF